MVMCGAAIGKGHLHRTGADGVDGCLKCSNGGSWPGCATGTGLGPAGEWLMAKCLARGVKLNRRWGGRNLALCPSLDSSLDQTKRELLANVHHSLGLASGALGGTHRPIQDSQTRIGARSNRPTSRVWICASC